MLTDEQPIGLPSVDEKEVLDWNALRAESLQPRGFGDARVTIWPRLLNVKSNKTHLSQGKAEDECSPHQDERQISLDTDRSFVLYPVDEKADRETLQAGLHQLLVSLFRKRPKLSYFQGYHDIISVFFLTLPPELHLPCVEKLSLHRLRDSMGSGLEPIIGLLRVTQNLLRLADIEYANVLERAASLPFYALSNLLTLFSHDMPTLSLIQHVFDYLLCRPPIAAVYLATAIILARKAEVLRLEEEEEEGLIHSLLSSFPNLEDGDILHSDAASAFPLKDEPSLDAENSFKDEDPDFRLPPSTNEIKEEGSIEGLDGPAEEVSERSRQPNDSAVLGEPTSEAVGPDTHSPSPGDPLHPSAGGGLNEEADGSDESIARSDISKSDILQDKVVPPVLNPVKEEDVEKLVPPVPIPLRPKSTRIVLTDLLKRADELYAEFPPTYPALALSSIMGPQSVVFTWSESPSSLPSDDTAEAMLAHPELVVYPCAEGPSQEKEKDRDTKLGRAARKSRRKQRNLLVGGSPLGQLERRTVVTSAVVVLAVAVAVYGIKSRSGPGATSAFDGYHGQVREWKRLSGWIGGAVAGISTRIANGLTPGP